MSQYPDWLIEKFGDNIPVWAEKKWGENKATISSDKKRYHKESETSLIKFSEAIKYILSKNKNLIAIEGLKFEETFVDFILVTDNKIIILKNEQDKEFSEELQLKIKDYINNKFSNSIEDIKLIYLSGSSVLRDKNWWIQENKVIDIHCLEDDHVLMILFQDRYLK